MDYIQEMISLTNDSNLNLEKEERETLISFTDEMVKFCPLTNVNYINNNETLKKALIKIVDKGFFIKYFEILMKRNEYTMSDFSERMDTKSN